LISSSTTCEPPHRVLLVDDDAVSLDLMALLLAHEGHQVLRANDAGAALELLAIETGAPVVPVEVLTVLVSTLLVVIANYLLNQYS